MNPLSPAVRSWDDAFIGGRAPARCQDVLARAAAPVIRVSARCDWVGDGLGAWPRLLGGPLFGAALAQVAGCRPSEAPTGEQETRRSPHPPPARETESPERPRRRAQPPAPTAPTSTAPTSTVRPRAAVPPCDGGAPPAPAVDRPFLCRLAGEPDGPAPLPSPTLPPPPPAKRAPRPEDQPRARRPVPAACPPGAWNVPLAERVARRVGGPAEDGASSAGPPGPRANPAAGPTNASAARRPGASPLAGTPAPPHLLQARSGATTAAPRGPAVSTAGGPAAATSFDRPSASGARRAAPARPEPHPAHAAPPPAIAPPDGSRQADRHTGDGKGARVTTPSHPPLLTPSRPYEPTLPVAAEALRRGARREAAEPVPYDTQALTAALERILGDEARRHGIEA